MSTQNTDGFYPLCPQIRTYFLVSGFEESSGCSTYKAARKSSQKHDLLGYPGATALRAYTGHRNHSVHVFRPDKALSATKILKGVLTFHPSTDQTWEHATWPKAREWSGAKRIGLAVSWVGGWSGEGWGDAGRSLVWTRAYGG